MARCSRAGSREATAGYDRDTFLRCLHAAGAARGDHASAARNARTGGGRGMLVGGTLTQLLGSLGTPYAFDPPRRLHPVPRRSRRAAVPPRPHADAAASQRDCSARAAAVVFGELPRCDEPAGNPSARAVVQPTCWRISRARCCSACPSGHTTGPTLTLPFGVRARVAHGAPSGPRDRGSGSGIEKRWRVSISSACAARPWPRWRRCSSTGDTTSAAPIRTSTRR